MDGRLLLTLQNYRIAFKGCEMLSGVSSYTARNWNALLFGRSFGWIFVISPSFQDAVKLNHKIYKTQDLDSEHVFLFSKLYHGVISLIFSYGEKGGFIIQNALRRMFPQHPELIKNVQPLTFQLFIEHLLVPHVATVLISQDRNLDAKDAYDVMLSSGEFGRYQFPVEDDDDELDGIIRDMTREIRNVP